MWIYIYFGVLRRFGDMRENHMPERENNLKGTEYCNVHVICHNYFKF